MSQFGIVNDPLNIFSATASGPAAPKALTEKQQRQALLDARQQFWDNSARQLADSVLNSDEWLNGSTLRKRELIDTFSSEVWPGFAEQAFQGLEETDYSEQLYKTRILSELNGELAAAERERNTLGNSLQNLYYSARAGVDNFFDASVAGSPFFVAGAANKPELLASYRKTVLSDPNLSDEVKDEIIQGLEFQETAIREDLDASLERFTDAILTSQQNEQARQEANELRRDRALRTSELIARGEDSPALEAFLEAPLADKVGQTLNLVVEQIPNVSASILAGIVGSVVTGGAGTLPSVSAASAALVAGQNASEAASSVLLAPIEDLQVLPEYRLLEAQGFTEEEIRNKIAQVAVMETVPTSSAIGAISGILGPEAIALRAGPVSTIISRLGTNRAARIGGSALASAVEEGLEEFAENISVNRAWNIATGDDRSWVDGGVDAAFMGALAGLVLGGASGVRGPAGVATPQAQTTNNTPAATAEQLAAGAVVANPLITNNTGSIQALEELSSRFQAYFDARKLPTAEEQQQIYRIAQTAEQYGVSRESIDNLLEGFQTSVPVGAQQTFNLVQGYANYVDSLNINPDTLPSEYQTIRNGIQDENLQRSLDYFYYMLRDATATDDTWLKNFAMTNIRNVAQLATRGENEAVQQAVTGTTDSTTGSGTDGTASVAGDTGQSSGTTQSTTNAAVAGDSGTASGAGTSGTPQQVAGTVPRATIDNQQVRGTTGQPAISGRDNTVVSQASQTADTSTGSGPATAVQRAVADYLTTDTSQSSESGSNLNTANALNIFYASYPGSENTNQRVAQTALQYGPEVVIGAPYEGGSADAFNIANNNTVNNTTLSDVQLAQSVLGWSTIPQPGSSDMGKLGTSIAYNSPENTTASQVLVRDHREGHRLLGTLTSIQGSGAANIQTALRNLTPSSSRALANAWLEFKAAAVPETFEDIAYFNRTTEQVIADAVVASTLEESTDPFYLSLPQNFRNTIRNLRNNILQRSIVVTENTLTPIIMPGVIDARSFEGQANNDVLAMGRFLAENGLLNQNQRTIVVNREDGTAHIFRGTRSLPTITSSSAYIPAHAYGDGTVFGGNQTTQSVVYLPSGRVAVLESASVSPADSRAVSSVDSYTTVNSLLASASRYNSQIRNGFTGNIYIMSPQSKPMSRAEQALIDAKGNPNAIPEAVLDPDLDVDGATITKALNGDFDSSVFVAAYADPQSDLTEVQSMSNPAIDLQLWEDFLQHAYDDLNDGVQITGYEVNLDPAEANPTTEGLTPTLAPTPLTDEQELNIVRQIADTLNTIISEESEIGANEGGVAVPQEDIRSLATTLRDVFNNDIERLNRMRSEAYNDAANRKGLEFGKTNFGPSKKASKFRSLGFLGRNVFVDKSAPFLEYISRVDPVTVGEHDDHPVWKSYKLMQGRIRGLSNSFRGEYMAPFIDQAETIADRLGMNSVAVRRDLGTYATAYHVLTEGAAAYRQTLLADIEQALAMPPSNTKGEIVQAAQDALAAYDQYQVEAGLALKSNQPVPPKRVRLPGGLSNAEWEAKIQTLLATGYTQAELEQGRQNITAAYEGLTNERLRANTLTIEEVEQWFPFTSFVPLTTSVQTEALDINNVEGTIFNPGKDHIRQGSFVEADNAYDAMDKYLSRISMEIASRDFTNELNNMYKRLTEKGNTYGLVKLSFAEIARLKNDERYNMYGEKLDRRPGWLYYEDVYDEDGNLTKKAYRFTFLDNSSEEAAKRADTVLQSVLVTPKAASTSLWEKPAANGLRKASGAFGRVLTKWNLTFPVRNALNDTLERFFNINARDVRRADGSRIAGTRIGLRMVSKMANPFYYARARAAMQGQNPDSYYTQYWQEFQSTGSFLGYNQALDSLRVSQLAQSRTAQRYFRRLGIPSQVLDSYNDYWNALPAFAQYVSARESGLTTGDAAYWTLSLLNFYESGKATGFLSTLYPFTRSTLQGGANLFRSLGLHPGVVQNPRSAVRSWAALTGLMMGMTQIIAVLRGMAGDDDETGVNRYDALSLRDLQFAIPLFDDRGGRYRVPVGFGLTQTAWAAANAFDRLERGIAEPGDAYFHVLHTFLQNAIPENAPNYSFFESPVSFIAHTFTPTALAPIANLAYNKNQWGTTIDYGSRPIGQRAFESGRHTTAQVWNNAAAAIYDTTKLDFTPEQIRSVVNGYAVGPLASIVAWLEQDNLYKSPIHQTTRQNLGPILTALGAASIYNTEMNISAQLYYSRFSDMNAELTRRGVVITDSANRGSPERAEAFVRGQMAKGGFTAQEIEDYITLRRANLDINKLDRRFRESIDPFRRSEDASEILRDAYVRWSSERHAIQTNAVRNVGYYDASRSYTNR